MGRRLLTALCWSLAFGGPGSAAEVPFSAVVSLELPDSTIVALGTISGSVSLSDEVWLFPASDLENAMATTFTQTNPPPFPPIAVLPEAFAGGRLIASSTSFGGPLALRGIAIVNALAGGFDALELPLSLGVLASPSSLVYTLSPASSALPVQAHATLSFGRWTTGSIELTGTHGGRVANQKQRSGSLLSTASGRQVINLVTPMHVHIGGADEEGAFEPRMIALAGRMVITVPSPSMLAGQLAAASVLLATAFRHRTRTSSRSTRRW